MTVQTHRKAVPLTEAELAAVNAARTAGTAEHDVLTELAGAGATRSEASTLHALIALGLRALRDQTIERGYAELAADMDDEDRAYRAAMRGRRRGSADR